MEWRSTAAASRKPVTLDPFLHLISETACAMVATGLSGCCICNVFFSASFGGGPKYELDERDEGLLKMDRIEPT